MPAMSPLQLVWTKEGDTEYVDHGPFRATVLMSRSAKGAMAIRVRIGMRDSADGDDTPVYIEVSAADLARQLASLKAHAEEELRVRAGQLDRPEGPDEEKTDRVHTASTGAPSPGFYMTKPPRGGRR